MQRPYGAVVGTATAIQRAGAILLAMAALGACSDEAGESSSSTTATISTSSTPTTAAPATGPATGEWEVVDPADVGLDPAVLDSLAADAEAKGSNCLVVVRDGRIAGEWYWNGTGPESSQEVFSVTKSVTSVLVGIAADDGALDVDDPAATWIPEWSGTPSEAVTVEHLLSNDSGRHWSRESDYSALLAAEDRTAYAIGVDQDAAPGTVWEYNNTAIQTLEQVLERATEEPVTSFVAERLLEPIGMSSSSLSSDPAGNGHTFFGLQSTCRDLARFGWLVVEDGAWGDEQIVSEAWLDRSLTSSQELNPAYGYLWWLNRASSHGETATGRPAEDVPGGQLAPGAPDDLVWALGLGGQVVQVHEPSRTVLVRLGPFTLESSYGPADAARLVTEALVDP